MLAATRKLERVPHHHVRLARTGHALDAHAQVPGDGFHHHLLQFRRLFKIALLSGDDFVFVGLDAFAVQEAAQPEQCLFVEILVEVRRTAIPLHRYFQNLDEPFLEPPHIEQVRSQKCALPRNLRRRDARKCIHVTEADRPLHAHLVGPALRVFEEFLHVFVQR